MDPLLKDLLETNFFKNSSILAGEGGIENKVNSVTVIDAPEGVKWLKGGELALTTAYSIKDDKNKQIELVEELVKSSSSGLGMKLRYLNNIIPEEMKIRADELCFPIFEIEERYSWLDVISFVMSRVRMYRSNTFDTNGETYRVFLDKVYREEGFVGIVQLLEYYTKLKAAIVYKDKLYQNSSNYFPKEKILNKNNWVLKKARNDGFSVIEKNLYAYEIKEDDKIIEWVAIDIIYKREKVGYVFLSSKERELKEEDYIFLEQASMAAEAETQRIYLSLITKQKYRDQFLNDLIKSKFDDYDEAFYKFRELGWNLQTRNSVLLVKVLDNIGIDDLSGEISSNFEEVIYGIYDKTNLIFIIPEAKDIASLFIEELNKVLKGIVGDKFLIGLGRTSDFKDLKRSFDEAKKVIEVVSKDIAFKNTYDYKDIGFYRLLNFSEMYHEAKYYVNDYLGPLVYSEKENKDELLETLKTFLENKCSFGETAKKMYMHPNSIRYRIEVIEEMCGIDLDTPKDIADITIALKLIPFIKG